MPRPTPQNPLSLLDSVRRAIGKAAILAHLDYTPPSATTTPVAAPAKVKRRKKRSDAGQARGPRVKKATKAKATPPAPKPKKPRLKRAKPRVDPATTVVELPAEQ